MLSDYNKLIAALVGNVVAMALIWASFKIPGIVTCTDPVVASTCKVFGTFGMTEVTAVVMAIVNMVFVERWAANTVDGKPTVPDPTA